MDPNTKKNDQYSIKYQEKILAIAYDIYFLFCPMSDSKKMAGDLAVNLDGIQSPLGDLFE